MRSTSVSVVIPGGPGANGRKAAEAIEAYLVTTGFTFQVVTEEGGLHHAASEATGDIVVVVDPNLPYAVTAIGDAVALVESGAADVVFGSRPERYAHGIVRSILVSELPDPDVQLLAFSAEAASLLFAESKMAGDGTVLEIAYLANKYGFRVEMLIVQMPSARRPRNVLTDLRSAISIRMTDRRNGYRSPRRCPVCFSSEVWSSGQVPGNVIRVCGRCKCRYLNERAHVDDAKPVRRELRAQPAASDPATDALDETAHGRTAKEKTVQRRLNHLRGQLPPRGRLLEIGVRDGSFGAAASREYEYVGIDQSAASARAARARGLEVYCSTLIGFVNTGPAFDAVTLYNVFENMPDPHDALAHVKDLLKPGGLLLISALDTEGFLFLLSERKRAGQNFRTRAILYSRSALIELLERSGFEIAGVAPDFTYRDHRFLRHRIAARWPAISPVTDAFLKLMPDPLLVSSGSIRIVARRRAGAPLNVRAIRSVEPTHAR